MDNGMELRVKDYCAFCPDFEADVDKVDILYWRIIPKGH